MKPMLILSAGLALTLAACGPKTEPAPVEPATAAPAATGDMSGMPMAASGEMSGSGTGAITAVDPAAGTVTIDHGPIPGVNWPAMTMAFTASPTILQSAKVGDQVQFDVTVKGPVAEVTEMRSK
ncbi:hypothetical protein BH10PSE2_BH10PSE2_04070 [soil metagenome]